MTAIDSRADIEEFGSQQVCLERSSLQKKLALSNLNLNFESTFVEIFTCKSCVVVNYHYSNIFVVLSYFEARNISNSLLIIFLNLGP